ncbi:hypothetical protein FGL91_18580 [Microbacterium sp. CBA3102]|uniref:hypothetical protein n=1 Tax=Microbacterium sp. CBA3102 TaxID=2603598 RepID=UPI0011BBC373|nr:hypothetical protein [Microbacterium sp. CBA3102]QEA30375.1 hypothetical protein FGL91_18580 [Microbacterium sp. CBA3102]
MEQLLALESDSVRDADVSASAIEEIVEISVYAVAETFDEAAAIADSTIRTAIHAAKGHTPDWQTIQTLAERADLVEA